MTAKQRQLLDFIDSYISTKRYSPSLHEMKEHMGVKTISTIHQHLENLVKGGYLMKDGYARGYVLRKELEK